MDNDRNLGVTEARFGLTLLICLLVAIGYVVLLRLGTPGESTIEVRPEVESRGSVAGDEPETSSDVQPLVLTIEPAEATAMRTLPPSDRPAPSYREDGSVPPGNPVLPAGSTDSRRR